MTFGNLLIGWRNIKKNGIFSVINIVGLSLGIAIVTLILFWIVDELNFDKFHKNIDNIYTVYEHQQYSEGQELFTSCTPFPLGKELVNQFDEVERATTFARTGKHLLRYNDRKIKEGPILCTDNNFLKVFSFDVIEGNANALSSPDKAIIDEDVATALFGSASAIGRMIKIDDNQSVTIGAVIKKVKRNSSLDFKILLPMRFLETAFKVKLNQWGNNWPRTSIIVVPHSDVKALDTKISNFLKEKGQENTTLHLFPFKKARLYSYSGKNNRIQYIYQFLGIAFIIIFIASINFINLSTARAEQRRSEVGIRKVLGANKFSILNQFLQEKGIMIVLSLLISVILILLFIPAFRSISGKDVTFSLLQNKYLIILLLGVIATVMVLSVVYPSLYVASFNPAQAIKKGQRKQHGRVGMKNLLIVVQFVLSVVLIISTLCISQQLKFINNYDLGYNHANLIYLPLNGEAKTKYEALKNELNTITGVTGLTGTSNLPIYGSSSSWGYDWEGKSPENKVLISKIFADRNFVETMGIKMEEGSNFPESYENVLNPEKTKSYRVLLNKEAIRRMQIKDPVGKYFGNSGEKDKGTIAGVIEDFHFQSLHSGVEPLVIMPLFEKPGYIVARINPVNFSQTIAAIKTTWKNILPQSVCEVKFIDDGIEEMYKSEIRISGLFRYFSFIAIFISSIGLFGVSLFIIERRRKEIGVRKVNGAKTGEVMVLLNRDFVRSVIIAFVIACPIAWLIMHRWLENFAFKTTLSWWIFAVAGSFALIIALLTVSWQTYQAAIRNPVEALRYE